MRPKRPAGTEDWTDEEIAAWRAQPWWRRYRLTFAWAPFIGAAVIGLAALARSLAER